jgi:hypothetical protein
MPDEEIPQILWHQSGVNQRGEPFVQLLLGERIIGQMSAEEARDHARAITESAEAAEQDAFLMDLMQHKMGLEQQQAAMVLADFRAYRMERTGKRGGPSNPRDWVMPDTPPKPFDATKR